MQTKFTWGDEVKIKKLDGNGKEIDVYAAVVGITPIETEQQSTHFKAPIGSTFCLVEYGDGSDELILEDKLEMYIPAKTHRE